MSTLWHLTGQIYCALCRSPREINEDTLINEQAFAEALEINPGLKKAYKRSPQDNRNAIRALLGAMSPFNCEQLSERTSSLPIVYNLGRVSPRLLHDLCEMYSPEVVESHIRYAYSREGYATAISSGKIERIPILETQIFDLVEAPVQLVEDMYSRNDAFEQLTTVQKHLTSLGDIPTEKEVMHQYDLIQQNAELTTRIADQNKEKKRQEAEDTRQQKENEIFKLRKDIERIELGTEKALEQINNELRVQLDGFQKELRILVTKHEFSKFTPIINKYSQLVDFVSAEMDNIAKAITQQMEEDLPKYFPVEYFREMLPNSSNDDAIYAWVDKVLLPLTDGEDKKPNWAKDQKYNDTWKQIRKNIKRLLADYIANPRILHEEFMDALTPPFEGVAEPSYVYLSFDKSEVKTALITEVQPQTLPNPECAIGVTEEFEDGTYQIFNSLGASGDFSNVKDHEKAARLRIYKFCVENLDNGLPIVHDGQIWNYYIYIKGEERGFSVEVVRAFPNFPALRLIQRPGMAKSTFIEAAVKGARTKLPISSFDYQLKDDIPRELEESALWQTVCRLDEFGPFAAIGVTAAAVGSILAAGWAVKKGYDFIRWVWGGGLKFWFVKSLFNYVDRVSKERLQANDPRYQFTQWYLNSLSRNHFDAISDFYLANNPTESRGFVSFVGKNSGFTVANDVKKVPSFSSNTISVPDFSRLTQLSALKKADTLEAGWKVEIIYYDKDKDVWWVRRSAPEVGALRKEIETIAFYYYQLDNTQFLWAIGASEKSIRNAVKSEYKALFSSPSTIKGLINLFNKTGNKRDAADIARKEGIDPNEAKKEAEVIEKGKTESIRLIRNYIYEQEEDIKGTPSPPEDSAPGGKTAKPTEYVSPTNKVTEEQPKPGDIQTPDGTIITKDQAKQMLGKMLHNLGDQVQQGGGADVQPPEGNEGEPAGNEESTDGGDTETPTSEEKPKETPKEPTEEKPVEVPKPEEGEKPSNVNQSPDNEEASKPDGEKKPEDDSGDEKNSEEEKKDGKEDDEEKKKKQESVAREINFRRILGLKKTLQSGGLDYRRRNLRESDLSLIRRVGRRESMTKSELIESIRCIRATRLHPFTQVLFENDLLMQYVASGMKTDAIRLALSLPEAMNYSPQSVGFALGQLSSTANTGEFLFEREDEEDITAMSIAEPVVVTGDVSPTPDELAAEETMAGTEVIANADKIATVSVSQEVPGDEIESIKSTLIADEIIQSYIETGNTEDALSRAHDIMPMAHDADIAAAVSEIMNTSHIDPVVPEETVAEIIDPDTPPAVVEPVAAAEEVPAPITAPEMEYPEDAVPEIETSVGDIPSPEEISAPIDAPPAVEINYEVPEESEVSEYEGYVLRQRGSITEVVVGKQIMKLPNTRLRILPTGADLASCLTEMNRGTSISTIAKRRLYNRVFAVPAGNIPQVKLSENANFLLLYLKEDNAKILSIVGHYQGYIVEGVAVIPIAGMNRRARGQLTRELGDIKSYSVCTRRALRPHPFRPICEELEVPEGAEGNEAAKAFDDAMKTLHVAQKAMIDFEGHTGKIQSLVSLGDKGAKTASSLEKLSKEINDVLVELKDVMTQFSDTHDVFSKEFPDAKAEDATMDAVTTPETTPTEPAQPQKPAQPTEKTPPAPPEATTAAPPADGEKPSADGEKPTDGEKPEEEKKAEEVAEALMSKYSLSDFIRREHRSKIGRLVIQEDRFLNPQTVKRVVEILIERADM